MQDNVVATEAMDAAMRMVDEFGQTFSKLRNEVSTCFIGQEELVENVLCALLAGGHVFA